MAPIRSAGACFTVDGGDQVCDNGSGDNDDNDGSILIANIAPGTHEVAESQTPDGYTGADPQSVEVPAGGTGEVTFVNNAVPTVTPTEEPTEVPTETPTEEPTLTPTEEPTEAPTETAVPSETPTEEVIPSETATEEAAPSETPTEEASPSETPTESAEAGSLVITSEDENGAPLSGTCYSIDGPASYQVCDNGDGDADSADGSIRIENVAAGDYTVTETQTPDGYLPADSQDVTVESGAEGQVSFSAQLAPTPEPTETPEAATGSIAVSVVDENGDPITGACFAVSGPSDAGPVCDNSEGDADDSDGTILIGDLLEGDYTVSETTAPTGYSSAADQGVTVSAGDQPATVQFANQAAPLETGNVRISSIANDGDSAGGGCYTVGSLCCL